MVHPDNIPKAGVKVMEKANEDAKSNEVNDDVKTIVIAIDGEDVIKMLRRPQLPVYNNI